jgi:carbamoyltransferase
MYTPKLIDLLGPPRVAGESITKRLQDIASSLQKTIEEAIVRLAQALSRIHPSENLCMAGGVSYNCVANMEVFRRGGFKRVWIQPAAGDNGAALGAALLAHYSVLASPASRQPARHDTCLGPQFEDDEILAALKEANIPFEQFSTEDLCRQTSALLFRGLIVGWFQSRMEFGPRALGNRSILANPCFPTMKDILNSRVKFREEFRPFAPAVLAEAASRYFDLGFESPFMLFTPQVRPEAAAKIPSVTHVDGSARVQTVSRSDNPRFHLLIEQFAKLSGIPILINTSFNVAGEPIVCTPADAVRCFLNTGIDALAIGDCLVRK